MRLIDADALIEDIVKFYDEAQMAETFEMVNKVCDHITEAPTIDAVSVVRGSWGLVRTVKTNSCPEHWLKCSVCGKYRVIKMGEAFPDWCENCGAKMDGGKDQ